jgi:hypothetical protein
LYLQSAYVTALESIPRVLAHPPVGLEECIRRHFLRRRESLLRQLNFYMSSGKSEETTERSKVDERDSVLDEVFFKQPSEALRKSIRERFPAIAKALEDNVQRCKELGIE